MASLRTAPPSSPVDRALASVPSVKCALPVIWMSHALFRLVSLWNRFAGQTGDCSARRLSRWRSALRWSHLVALWLPFHNNVDYVISRHVVSLATSISHFREEAQPACGRRGGVRGKTGRMDGGRSPSSSWHLLRCLRCTSVRSFQVTIGDGVRRCWRRMVDRLALTEVEPTFILTILPRSTPMRSATDGPVARLGHFVRLMLQPKQTPTIATQVDTLRTSGSNAQP